jgi:uncharacterized protein
MTNIPFSNEAIANDELPDLSQLQQKLLSPLYIVAHLATIAIIFVILISIPLCMRYQPFIDIPVKPAYILSILASIFAALGAFVIIYSYFADKLKRYALREQDLSYTSGLIFRNTITQPILRIQHIEVKRGPIERKLGLATLQVFSAGGVSHTFEIPGLPLETARRLRQFILSHTSHAHPEEALQNA